MSSCQAKMVACRMPRKHGSHWRNDGSGVRHRRNAVALVFDFANGWHDSANSIATVVATRVLSPRAAVVWAAFFNFIAFLVFGTFVAQTIGGDLIRISVIEKEWRILTL